MNKCFIALRRDIIVIFLARERRFALAKLKRCTFGTLQLLQSDFTTWTSAPRIMPIGFGPTDLTHGFVHGLKDVIADEGRMAESFDEKMSFSTLQYRINALLSIAGISFLYFSLKSEDLRLQNWNIPLLEHFSFYNRTYYTDFSCRIILSDWTHGLDPRICPWTRRYRWWRPNGRKLRWEDVLLYPAVTTKCFITQRRDILFIFLAKERRFAFANLEHSTFGTLQFLQSDLLHGL